MFGRDWKLSNKGPGAYWKGWVGMADKSQLASQVLWELFFVIVFKSDTPQSWLLVLFSTNWESHGNLGWMEVAPRLLLAASASPQSQAASLLGETGHFFSTFNKGSQKIVFFPSMCPPEVWKMAVEERWHGIAVGKIACLSKHILLELPKVHQWPRREELILEGLGKGEEENEASIIGSFF